LEVRRGIGREHERKADDGREERHEDDLAHKKHPPHAGGADLAELGANHRVHAATSSAVWAVGSGAVRRKNTSSSESPRVDSSWTSRPSAKAAAPTSAAVAPVMCASSGAT